MKNIKFGKPIIGEEEKNAVLDILSSDILVHGPKSKEFEKSFADFAHADFAVSVSSCTAALHLSYFYLDIGEGDEVIVPAQTHNATAHSVEYTGAKPVFVDAELDTGNIDISQIENKITKKTKAISIVHYLGMPVDMDKINAIAKKYNLFVVEDAALAVGTFYKGVHAGLLGDVGCFSFYPVKHFTTAEGGMLLTKHSAVAEKIVKTRAFGVDKVVGTRDVPGVYDVTMLGYNYRMNEIQAALGVEQIKRVSGFLKVRKENYERLENNLSDIKGVSLFRSSHGDFQSSYYCLSIILDDKLAAKRFKIISRLKDNGVGTSVYYPKPVPHLKYYIDKYGYTLDTFSNAARISYNSIALPVGPHLGLEDMDYIADNVTRILKKV